MSAAGKYRNGGGFGAARAVIGFILFSAIALAQALLCAPATAAKLEVIHEFTGPDGCAPKGGLAVDPNTGILYGTATYCGGAGGGTVFTLTPPPPERRRWKFEVVYDFQGGADGSQPETAPTLRFFDGEFYSLFGTTHNGGLAGSGALFELLPIGRPPWDLQTVHKFSCDEGAIPNSPLQLSLTDPSSNFLYGTTSSAGCGGIVFRVDRVLLQLQVINNPDKNIGTFVGNHPQGVTIDANGTLFGTAFDGEFAGTVFRMDQFGKGKILHAFGGPEGLYPQAPPILGPDGAMYGTASEGGRPRDCPESPGCGVVWKKPPFSRQKVLHSFRFFTRNQDGMSPVSPLVLDEATGTLYGTTFYGGKGTTCGGVGGSCGTIFKIDDEGNYEVLWNFPRGGPANPQGQLVFHDGALYGTSYDGGKPCPGQHYIGCGTVWKLTP